MSSYAGIIASIADKEMKKIKEAAKQSQQHTTMQQREATQQHLNRMERMLQHSSVLTLKSLLHKLSQELSKLQEAPEANAVLLAIYKKAHKAVMRMVDQQGNTYRSKLDPADEVKWYEYEAYRRASPETDLSPEERYANYEEFMQAQQVYRQDDAEAAQSVSRTPPTHYAILGVDRNASEQEIREAYFKKALEARASGTDPKKIQQIEEAYRVLREQRSREAYDAELRLQQATRPVPEVEAGSAPRPHPTG